ncbi:unnamed protein product [Durusdinium trenchii]|uniref:SMB domain-containing protein n=1 Tax=Durusdinium trenchii TaxID=1381693 RepID=A0ABP0HMS0_9DINO
MDSPPNSARGGDEQKRHLMGMRAMSKAEVQDSDASARCCQTFATVVVLLALAYLLLKGCNSLVNNFEPKAGVSHPSTFLPPPPVERPEQHGWVQVVDDDDVGAEAENHGYTWNWEGSKRYAFPEGEQPPCYYEYEGKPNADCFCQLAGNKACQKMPKCHCSQGCTSDLTWRHKHTTTFKNFKYATGCQSQSSVALLTVPESHFQDIRYLKTWCPKGAQVLLAEMLKKSFETYREVVDPGPVRQCLHAAQLVSVPWLHLHTVCSGGKIDGLPGSPQVGWCSEMHSSLDAEPLAASVMLWAERLYGVRTNDNLPSTCSDMGCGIRGVNGRCSCHRDCRGNYSNCCGDFSQICHK